MEATKRMKALLESDETLTEGDLDELRDELEATDEYVDLLVKRIKALEKTVDAMHERLKFHGLM